MDPAADLDALPSLSRREAARARGLDKLPRWYSPWAHLAATTGVGVATLTLALSQLHGVRPLELLVLPATFVFANAFEWRVHKKVLHKRTWPFQLLFDRHTPQHHVVFTEDDMALRSTREFGLVLIPAIGVLGAVISAAPAALLLGWLASANAGWLMLATSGLYMVFYELSHLVYHVPEDHPIGGSPLVRKLRRHHARHHDPRHMQRYNFNVTVPLFDWIMGTMAPATESPNPGTVSDARAPAR